MPSALFMGEIPMDWKKLCIIPLAALLLTATACNEQAPDSSAVAVLTQEEKERSAASAVLEEGGMKQVGDPVPYSSFGAQMEATVQKVQIFEHYTDAGIQKDDCSFGVKDTPFVLLDVKVKKCSGPEREESDWDSFGAFTLTNKENFERKSQGETGVMSPEICYYDGPGKNRENDAKGYEFWLDPGEEGLYQLGWCLHDGSEKSIRETAVVLLTETEELVLAIGPGSSPSSCVDLNS